MAIKYKKVIQLTSDGTSSPYILPDEIEESNSRLFSLASKIIGGGTALFEITNSDKIDIENNSASVEWYPAPLGVHAVSAIDFIPAPITAIRCTVAGGGTNTYFTIRGIE